MIRCLIVLCVVFATGCGASTPASTLPTPGTLIRVTDERVIMPVFSLDYPAGWRVITSAADAPFRLILAAPGNCAIMDVWLSTPDEPPLEISETCGTVTLSILRWRRIGSRIVTVRGEARSTEGDATGITAENGIQRTFARIFESLEATR